MNEALISGTDVLIEGHLISRIASDISPPSGIPVEKSRFHASSVTGSNRGLSSWLEADRLTGEHLEQFVVAHGDSPLTITALNPVDGAAPLAPGIPPKGGD